MQNKGKSGSLPFNNRSIGISTSILLMLTLPDISLCADLTPRGTYRTTFISSPVAVSSDKVAYITTKYNKDNLEAKKSIVIREDKNSASKEIHDFTNISLPTWSHTGDKLFYLSNNKIISINSDLSASVLISPDDLTIDNFIISKDANKVAYVASKKSDKNRQIIKFPQSSHNIKHLYVYNISKEETKKINTELIVNGSGDFGNNHPNYDFSPKGDKLAFTYLKSSDVNSVWLHSNIAILDLDTDDIVKIQSPYQLLSEPRFSPNGAMLAFSRSGEKADYFLSRYISIYNLADNKIINLAKTPNEGPDFDMKMILGWDKSSTALYIHEPHHTSYRLYEISVNTDTIKHIQTPRDINIFSPSLSTSGEVISFIHQNSNTPPEVFSLDIKKKNINKISNINSDMDISNIPKSKIITWQSFDSKIIEGLLALPLNSKPPHPVIVVAHGGPMGLHSDRFLNRPYPYPFASFLNNGFALFLPNPRGSTGYGIDFRRDNISDWGGGDLKDIIYGVEHLINKKIIDKNNTFIAGWSYGGYLTAMALTDTNVFKAGSMGAGISNILSMRGTTDLLEYIDDYFPGEDEGKFSLILNRSPAFKVTAISAPLLIQHGDVDTRVPVSQSQEMYYALKKENKEAYLEIYKDSDHWYASVTQDIDMMQSNLDWFISQKK